MEERVATSEGETEAMLMYNDSGASPVLRLAAFESRKRREVRFCSPAKFRVRGHDY